MDFDLNGNRYEIKMVFENANRFEVENWIRLHSYAFGTAYPDRQVNNIYFDTFSMDAYNDHIEGVGQRRKLRFRWYGPDLTRAHGQLELKHKSNFLGWKTIQPIRQTINLAESSWVEIQQTLQGEVKGGFQEMLAVSRPVLINAYQRQYFASADGEVRLTLDYDMHGYDQSLSVNSNIDFQLPSRDLVIIEFKTIAGNAKILADVLAEFPLYVEAFSKYVEMSSRVIEQ